VANPSTRERTYIDLLSEVLGVNRDVAAQVLVTAGGKLRELGKVTHNELVGAGVVARKRQERFRALIAFALSYGEEPWEVGAPFRGSYDVYAHFRERLAAEPREHFYAVLLDNKNRKLKEVCVSVGTLTGSLVVPRDVYLPAIRESAAAVIFVHNHPSGDPTPSKEDIDITRRLREVGDLIGIRVLDHVIIGQGRYVSFVDDGYW
jgi:DNA repair protein RadC